MVGIFPSHTLHFEDLTPMDTGTGARENNQGTDDSYELS